MGIVGRVIHLAGVLRARADEALRPLGLHYTDLDVLATLRRSGDPFQMTPTALSRLVLLTSGAMTAAIKRLQARGLVVRAPDPSDGRVSLVVLTSEGRDLIDRAIEARFAEAADAVSELSAGEREALAGHLRALLLSLS